MTFDKWWPEQVDLRLNNSECSYADMETIARASWDAAQATRPEARWHVDGRWCSDLHCSRCYSADTWIKAQAVAPTDEKIISAFSNGGSGAEAMPTRQPHAPFLTNDQIVWVVRRFLAGSTPSPLRLSEDGKPDAAHGEKIKEG